MKLVKCVDNKNRENELTINRIYKVLWENDWNYEVNCDNGKIVIFFKSRFTELETEQTKEGVNKMKFVKCINNKDFEILLTINKLYMVLDEHDNYIKIIDDKGEIYFYNKNRFEEVQTEQTKEECKNIYCKSYNEDCNNNCQIDNYNECMLSYIPKEELIKPTYYNKDNGISPFEYIKANNLDFFEGNVIKYITRYKEKNGIEDLIKAKTYLEEIIKNYEK